MSTFSEKFNANFNTDKNKKTKGPKLQTFDQLMEAIKTGQIGMNTAQGGGLQAPKDISKMSGKELVQEQNNLTNAGKLAPTDEANLPFYEQNREIANLNTQADKYGGPNATPASRAMHDYFKGQAQSAQGAVDEGKANLARIAEQAKAFYPDGFNGTYWDEIPPNVIDQAFVYGIEPQAPSYGEAPMAQNYSAPAQEQQQQEQVQQYQPQMAEAQNSFSAPLQPQIQTAYQDSQYAAPGMKQSAMDNMQANWARNTGIDNRGNITLFAPNADAQAANTVGIPVEQYQAAQEMGQSAEQPSLWKRLRYWASQNNPYYDPYK